LPSTIPALHQDTAEGVRGQATHAETGGPAQPAAHDSQGHSVHCMVGPRGPGARALDRGQIDPPNTIFAAGAKTLIRLAEVAIVDPKPRGRMESRE
jgi:hypothetical protein